jgi:leader peptidase (prepilin peptidase)/N-methyltransferase
LPSEDGAVTHYSTLTVRRTQGESFSRPDKDLGRSRDSFSKAVIGCNQGAKTGQMMVFWVATGVLTAGLAAVAIIDLRTLRIPDLLSLPLIAVGLIQAYAMSVLPFWHHAVGAMAGFAILAAVGEWYFRHRGIDGLGLGDAKLFAAAGAWLGWQALPMVLLIAALGGLAFALLRGGATRMTAIAFGPWLAWGFWLAWVWAHRGTLTL